VSRLPRRTTTGSVDRGLRSGTLLAAATVTASLLSYAFNLVLTRALGPQGFGSVGALLGLAVIGSVPATALQLECARLVASGRDTDIRWLVGRAGVAVSAVTMAAGLALAPLIDHVLRLETLWDAVLLALLLFPQTLTGALLGVLLGRGRLGLFSFLILSVGLLRLAAGAATDLADAGPTFALAAAALGAALSMGLGLLAVGLPSRRPRAAAARPGARELLVGLFRATAGAAALMVLLNVDLLVARAALDDQGSGTYAFLTIFGRVTFWTTGFLSLWVFPRVARSPGSRRPVGWALAVIAVGGALAAAASMLLGPELVRVLAGPEYAGAAPYVGAFAVAGTLMSVIQLGTYVDVARRRHGVSIAAWGAAGVIAATTTALDVSSIWGIITVTNGVLGALTLYALYRLRAGAPVDPGPEPGPDAVPAGLRAPA